MPKVSPSDETNTENRSAFCSVELQVGEMGFLSSWLMLGPIAESETVGLLSNIENGCVPREGQYCKGAQWTSFHFSDENIKFEAKKGYAVVLFVSILSDKPQTVYISTGSSGPITVQINRQTALIKTVARNFLQDSDLSVLELLKGKNDLFIVLRNTNSNQINASVRLMNDSFAPAEQVSVCLPEDKTSIAALLQQKGRLQLKRSADLISGQININAAVVFSGGHPKLKPSDWTIISNSNDVLTKTQQNIALNRKISSRTDFGNFVYDNISIPKDFVAAGYGAVFKKDINVDISNVKELSKAVADLSAALTLFSVEKSTLESLSYRIDHLRKLIERGDRDYNYLVREIRLTAHMAKSVREGIDPYLNKKNELQRRGYVSSLDDSLQPYALYVPFGVADGNRKFAMVVALHGLNSTPMKILQTVMGIPMEEGETKLSIDRHPKPIQPAPMFVLAPGGFGNSNYRTFGEVDVLEVIERVTRYYPIDPNRIYITGPSMGGIGAASIPLRHPDIFAASAPLCGYHSLFLYRGIMGKTLKNYERFLVESNSNVYWAVNGKNIPMYVVHGLKDSPGQSRVLVNRYRNAKYPITFETLNLGHNVWDETYKNHNIFKQFSSYIRQPKQRQIVFETASLRHNISGYLEILEVEKHDQWASVKGNWQTNGKLVIKTQNISNLNVRNEISFGNTKGLIIEIDNSTVPVSTEDNMWNLVKKDNRWALSLPVLEEASLLKKRPRLSGPISDALYEPLLFVYGTKNQAEENLSLRLINQMKQRKVGVTIDWPVKADIDVTDADIKNKSIVIIGTPSGNHLLDRIEKELPFRVEKNAIIDGKKQYIGRSPTAAFIYPNPLNRERYVTVYTSASLEGLYYVNHLPEMLADYIIFDGPTWDYKGGRILDSRPILAAGFFNSSWSL